VAEGNEAAFRQLFHRYTPMLFPAVTRMVKQPEIAKEIVQEVFLRVWERREQFGTMENPVGWMYRVAANLSVSHLRKTAAHLRWLESSTPAESSPDDASDKASLGDLQRLIHEAINSLPPKRKTIFKLSREEGWSIDEIAAHLNLSRTTVKNQISIALKAIQNYLNSSTHLFLPWFVVLIIFF